MERKPEWLRVRYNQQAVSEVAELMRDLKLNTVCKAANCPNLGECYQKHTATFMILGDVCTRNCRFCNVTCGKPLPPDPDEPENVAQAAKKLGLRHVVLTCSTRDDLPDGGAEHFAKTVRAIRALCPGTTVETLTSDMKGSHEAAGSAPGQDGKTCREIGASSSFRSKVENNDVWKVHQRAYKKYFARIRSGLMTKGEFEVWSRQAADLRDAALERYARAENEEERQRIAQEIAEALNAE